MRSEVVLTCLNRAEKLEVISRYFEYNTNGILEYEGVLYAPKFNNSLERLINDITEDTSISTRDYDRGHEVGYEKGFDEGYDEAREKAENDEDKIGDAISEGATMIKSKVKEFFNEALDKLSKSLKDKEVRIEAINYLVNIKSLLYKKIDLKDE
jgi:flagellar biosynthesis/type III secretory pathway protein FliH